MALFKSQVLTQASGSVGGLTYTRAKGGMVMRARAVPVDPSTALQVAPRAALAAAVSLYSVLPSAIRAAWELYAANVPVTNRLGDQIYLSGQNMFVRSRTIYELLTVTLGQTAFWDGITAPTAFSLPSFTTPTQVADVSSGITITTSALDNWAEKTGAFMLVFQGKTCSAARNYFKGPWRIIGAIEGDVGTPPTITNFNAATIAARGYPLSTSNCCNVSVSVFDQDGRISNRRRITPAIIVP